MIPKQTRMMQQLMKADDSEATADDFKAKGYDLYDPMMAWGCVWDDFAMIVASCWHNFGITLASGWHHFGTIFKSC